ncbi:MAG TPA: head GIN domain-containing protein [Chitinophagaceae bacterium]|nr:head GIN domain-containing protein [Chitinophagaceae bacterium]
MKNIFFSFLLIIVFSNFSFAQKTIDDANAEKRTVASFHGIEVGTGIVLTLTKGNSEEVAVSASDTLYRDKIVTEVVNGILKIHYETKTGAINHKNERKELKAYVSYKTIDLLHVSTGAKVNIDGKLESPSLDLKANTGSLVNGEVNIGTLKVDQNTGSKITLTGKVDQMDASGSTGSKFIGENLSSNSCHAEMSTGAGMYISVEKQLSVKANTGGYVKYKGTASINEIKTNTGGFVSKI